MVSSNCDLNHQRQTWFKLSVTLVYVCPFFSPPFCWFLSDKICTKYILQSKLHKANVFVTDQKAT